MKNSINLLTRFIKFLSFDGVHPDRVVPHFPGLLGGHPGLLGLVQPPPQSAGLLGPQVGGLVFLSLLIILW